jgi:hypothetical protein
VSRLSRKCGILNISQPYRPARPVTGIALLLVTGNTIYLRSVARNSDHWTTEAVQLNITIRKLGLFPSSGERAESPTLLGSSERANLVHSIQPISHHADRFRSKFKSCGICGGQSGTGQVYHFPLPPIHRLFHTRHHPPSGAGTVGQTVGQVPTGLIPTQPQQTKCQINLKEMILKNSLFLISATLLMSLETNLPQLLVLWLSHVRHCNKEQSTKLRGVPDCSQE